MKGYERYIKDVKEGKVVASNYIKLAISRFLSFKEREDIYFDEVQVDDCINFFEKMKHFEGRFASTPFKLLDWQQFIVASIIGLKYKDTGYRVCRETYIQIARKAGKDAFIAGLSLYMMIADGENSPEIACLANSREQARILFDKHIKGYAKSLDPKGNVLKYYRNYINLPANNGSIRVFSADASKLDGFNFYIGIIDEFHEQKDRKLYDVIKSSMGSRTQPLMIVITTAGFNLESPCHSMYELSIEILNKIKDDDSFFPFLFCMDPDDDWEDEDNWVKCQPNLDITVTREFMRGEVTKAKNDATAEVGILTKTFNMWCQAFSVWIKQEEVVKCMKKVNIEDYRGYTGYIGVDLSSVGDFTSISLLIPLGNKNVYKTWTFLPEETLKNSPNAELYRKFINEGSMIATPGNVCDYDYIIQKIGEINNIVNIQGIYYDQWNSTGWAIKCTEMGYNMVPFSQAIGNFNGPTKEFERQIKTGTAIIDKSSNVLWQFGNVILKLDHNGNSKPSKDSYNKKIDSIISLITATGASLKNPITTDFEIISL